MVQTLVLADVVSTVGILGWIIIGGIAGALAGRVVEGGGFGIVGDIVVGIVGALLGGVLAHLLGIDSSVGLLGSFLLALIGAIVLLAILRLISGGRATA
ncbi:MAG: GlsB/YeaQ/YmgE family stress response membrane protein [Ktedonobacterales bacterium]